MGDGETGLRQAGAAGVSPLLALLRAYRDLLEHRPATIVWLRRRRGPAGLLRVPCPRWIVGYFLAVHVRRTLADLERRYTARIALEEAEPGDREALVRLDAFRRSLPKVLVGGVAIASGLTGFSSLGLAGLRQVMDTVGVVDRLRDAWSAVAEGNTVAEELALAGVVVPLTVALVTAVPVSCFRLKRALLNVYPALDSAPDQPASRHDSRSTGVYHLERRAFAGLRAAPPRELPIDLLAGALPLLALSALLVALVVVAGQLWAEDDPGAAFVTLLWATIGVLLLVGRTRRAVRLARERVQPTPPRSAETPRIRARWRAQLIDVLLIAMPTTAVWIAVAAWLDGDDQAALAWAAPVLGALAYGIACLARRGDQRGQPFGKTWTHTAVVRTDGAPAEWWRLLYREVVFKWSICGVFSPFTLLVPLALDLAWPYFDRDKRALHDVAAGTMVVRVEPQAELAPIVAPA